MAKPTDIQSRFSGAEISSKTAFWTPNRKHFFVRCAITWRTYSQWPQCNMCHFIYSLDSPLRDLDSQGRSHLLAHQLASGSSLSGVISYGPFGGVNAVNVTASTAVTAKNVSRCKVYLACEPSRVGPAVTGLAPLSVWRRRRGRVGLARGGRVRD